VGEPPKKTPLPPKMTLFIFPLGIQNPPKNPPKFPIETVFPKKASLFLTGVDFPKRPPASFPSGDLTSAAARGLNRAS